MSMMSDRAAQQQCGRATTSHISRLVARCVVLLVTIQLTLTRFARVWLLWQRYSGTRWIIPCTSRRNSMTIRHGKVFRILGSIRSLVQKVCISWTPKTLVAQLLAESASYNTFAASQPRQQYDDTTWQTPQNFGTGSQPGTEATLETSAALNAQLLAESALYDTFAASQPQPFEHDASSYPLDDSQLHTSMIPWTNDPSLLVGGHPQSLATQLPGLPLDGQPGLQSYMNNNPTTGQHGQILGEIPECPTMFDLGRTGDRVYHTNSCMHPDHEISTLGYGRNYTHFNAPLPSAATSLHLYGSTPQAWQSASDSSAFPDFSQQVNLPSSDAGTFQDGTGYNPTHPQYYADAAPSFGPSSRDVQGNGPDTFDHSCHMSTLGVSPYQDIGEQAFIHSTSAFVAALAPFLLTSILSHVRHRLTASSIRPRCSYIWE
jgi:hypothetical protein